MKVFEHILVATDFSESSSAAVDMAVALATSFNAELTLLHAWEISVYPYMEYVLGPPDLMRDVEAAAARALEESLQTLKRRAPWAKSALRVGTPWREILDAQRALRADSIVMGTHGRRGINHALLGSVAEKVVRFSEVPVLTVRPAADV